MMWYIILGAVAGLGIIAAAVWLGLRGSHKGQGTKGEKVVSDMLKSLGGNVLDDYMLLDGEGNSHQIDHIFISENGVFVIETKNCAGTVYGTEEGREWTQSLRDGKITNKFYSPIKQNASHVYHVRKMLPNGSPIFSCVVFPRADISNITAENVFNMNGLYNYIKSRQPALSDEQVDEAVQILENNRDFSVSKRKHVSSIKKRVKDVERGICPRCHGKLVLREGPNGKFYGCSNYPKCKFTKNL